MIKLEHVVLPSPEQMDFIIEGMRNPMNSWEKSDSGLLHNCLNDREKCPKGSYILGKNDYSLMWLLSEAGTDHRKFMRMMPVYVRITAPLYWWKEFDTYKVGTVANSCSTMHKIHEKEFTLEDFSCEHLGDYELTPIRGHLYGTTPLNMLKETIDMLNYCRKCYIEDGKNKDDWWQMIQLLPSSYNQTRNVMMNYEVLANIYESRRTHKLDEWRELCKWIENLPYSELITGKKEEE